MEKHEINIEKPQKETLILIVDDMSLDLNILGTILEENNYPYSIASSGKQALEKVKTINPDLILLDVNMPEMNGIQVCEKLKASPGTAHIPVVFLTAKVNTEDIVRGFEAGASDYVTKPFNPRELLSRINTHLSLKKAQDDIKMYERDSAITAMAITASHEINQPLTVLQGNLELFIKSYNLEQLTEKQKKNIIRMEESVKGISDILVKFQNFKSVTMEEYIKDKKMVIFEE